MCYNISMKDMREGFYMTDLHAIIQILENNNIKLELTKSEDDNLMLQVDSHSGEKVTMVFDGFGQGNFLYFK